MFFFFDKITIFRLNSPIFWQISNPNNSKIIFNSYKYSVNIFINNAHIILFTSTTSYHFILASNTYIYI